MFGQTKGTVPMLRLWNRRHARESRPGRRGSNQLRPEVGSLEVRQLKTVSAVDLKAVPDILIPPNGQFMTVKVSGTTTSYTQAITPDTYPEVPKVSFQVTDEYRRFEPRGPVAVTLERTFPFKSVGKPYHGAVYKFSFNLKLPAERSSRDADGRQFSVLVAADDTDNGQGTTVPVLVPVDQAAANAARTNQASRALLLKRLRALPPVAGSGVSTKTFFQQLGFG